MLVNYFSEEDVSQFRLWMEWADNYVIVAHVSPDGDAVGSTLALAQYLQLKGKNAVTVLPDSPPEFLNWMHGADGIITFDGNPEKAARLITDADVVCCLDFNAIGRVAGVATSLLYSKAKKIMIDHHRDTRPFCDVTLSRPEASSTSELIFHFICALGDWGSVNRQIAECLCAGMITDTGGFTYNSNSSQFFFVLSQLIDKDVDKDLIYRRIYHNYSENRLRMTGYVLSEKMEMVPDSGIALITLTDEEQRRFSSSKGDTEGFVNLPLQISGVKFTAFLREDRKRGIVKISLRSVDDVPCNRFASEFFKGGGHLNASGGEFEGSVEECREAFLRAVNSWRSSSEKCIRKIFNK